MRSSREVWRHIHRGEAACEPAPSARAIETDRLTIRYGSNVALNGVSVTIPPGVLTVVAGPPGSGKTTLLKALLCELSGDDGSVAIQQVPARLWPAKKRTACVFACPGAQLNPCPLLGSDLCQATSDENEPNWGDSAFLEALELLGLTHLYGRTAASVCERDRLRLALAGTLGPFVAGAASSGAHLWLDDPLDGIDRLHRHRLLEWLKRTAGERQTTLLTATDDALAMSYADYAILLSRGLLVAQGHPPQALSADKLSRAFGSPAN
ncbi:MAG TPA: ABC transporter ATP-binding protein [Bryobacteraceae bacterium]|nr:ABC transporter ATP-binding protein [Bryobacteraceae bacterium]